MDQETIERFAPLIEQAAEAMRGDPDTRWHAVAELLGGGPLGYAQMIDRHPNRERMIATYQDGSRGVEVARTYLAAEREAPKTAGDPSARERVARYLWIKNGGSPEAWSQRDEAVAYLNNVAEGLGTHHAELYDRAYAGADEILAVIAGKEG